jgi:hypothetical protein
MATVAVGDAPLLAHPVASNATITAIGTTRIIWFPKPQARRL